tara:strand:+ start:141 stop:389 length:249 start_codon:yes stop_codon:yes gene_type:complete
MSIEIYNIGKLAEEAVLRDFKDNLIERVTDNLVADFKINAEELVKSQVEKLTIDAQSYMNARDMVQELKIYCKWANDCSPVH